MLKPMIQVDNIDTSFETYDSQGASIPQREYCSRILMFMG